MRPTPGPVFAALFVVAVLAPPAVRSAPPPPVSGGAQTTGGIMPLSADSLAVVAGGVRATGAARVEAASEVIPSATSFASPLSGAISAWAGFGFGECNSSYENRHHLGLDSRPAVTPTGTPVFACADGMVRYSTQGSVGGYGSWAFDKGSRTKGRWSRGYAVVIEHHLARPRVPEAEWVTTLYGHVMPGPYDEAKQAGLVPSGTVVHQGQYIARVADYVLRSGANAHHLHLGVHLGRYGAAGINYTQGYGPVCDESRPTASWATGGWTPPREFLADYPTAPRALAAVDWPMFKGEMTRAGVSGSRAIGDPVIRWRHRVGIQGWLNNPVVVGNRVFVGSSGDNHNEPDDADGVYGFDLRTGDRLWFSPAGNDANGVAFADGLVIATGDEGAVWALDAGTGNVAWRVPVAGGKVYTNPLIVGDLVVVGGEAGDVVALEVQTGTIRWSARLDGAIRGGASSDGRTVYVASQGGDVGAFTLTGEPLWRTRVTYQDSPRASVQDAQIYPAPTVAGDLLVVGYRRDSEGHDPAVVALDRATGQRRWPLQPPPEPDWAGRVDWWANVRSSPAYYEGLLIYAEAYSNHVEALSAEDGRIVWESTCGVCQFPHWPSPAIAGGQVLIPRNDGGLYALDARSGSLRWSLYLGAEDLAGPTFPDGLLPDPQYDCAWVTGVGQPILASPAVAGNGCVVVGTEQGYLYCIGDRSW
jgi:outer membrane protein assembly factor BamB/murein DD-endopeptidase MepM/ murein hydrolase activator NlpD